MEIHWCIEKILKMLKEYNFNNKDLTKKVRKLSTKSFCSDTPEDISKLIIKAIDKKLAYLQEEDFSVSLFGLSLEYPERFAGTKLHVILLGEFDVSFEWVKNNIDKFKEDLETVGVGGYTPLQTAIELKKFDYAHIIIEAGACVENRGNENNLSPLFLAVFYKNSKIIESILKYKTKNFSYHNPEGEYILDFAKRVGFKDIYRLKALIKLNQNISYI